MSIPANAFQRFQLLPREKCRKRSQWEIVVCSFPYVRKIRLSRLLWTQLSYVRAFLLCGFKTFQMEDYKFLFKVVLVGNAGVGKTCLVRRFTQGLFPPGQGATIGVDFMIKTVEIEGEKIKLQIWDTAGQERFRSITQSYYRSAHALILAYDISCQPTFDCLPDWLREIEEYASSKVLRVLVGNKTDREDREIPTAVGEDFAARHNMYFIETSAKEADNVERLFMEIAADLMEQARCKELPRYDGNSPSLNGRTTVIGEGGCCSKFS